MALDFIGVGEKRTPTFLITTSSHENPGYRPWTAASNMRHGHQGGPQQGGSHS